MIYSTRRQLARPALNVAAIVAAATMPSGCAVTTPSIQGFNTVPLPVPASTFTDGDEGTQIVRVVPPGFKLSPRSLIPVAFNLQPGIKSSFQRFKSEEARYDFFVVSRDSLTPRLRTTNDFGETRSTTIFDNGVRRKTVTRDRSHTVEFAVEKRFFDTTELDVSVGYQTTSIDDDIGNYPFISASLRYPLWVSRQKLERASEDIFRRNELDDVQLGYIRNVRNRLQFTLFRFHIVIRLRSEVRDITSRKQDLSDVRDKMPQAAAYDADRRRIDAEIARLGADIRTRQGRYDIDLARLKEQCGIPFETPIKVVDEPFNPFDGMTHKELLAISIDTDPEIATLHNAVRNSEVQLDLAQRGQWDVTLLLNGRSAAEGRATRDGASDWSVSAGFDISAVDPRVTGSLIRQAQANIHRFKQAIERREREIFVDTLEPLIRLETVGLSRTELIANLSGFRENYRTGVDEYIAGRLNMDDLLIRRENLFNQQQEVSQLTFLLAVNVAELLSATGKFFELLDWPTTPPPAGG